MSEQEQCCKREIGHSILSTLFGEACAKAGSVNDLRCEAWPLSPFNLFWFYYVLLLLFLSLYLSFLVSFLVSLSFLSRSFMLFFVLAFAFCLIAVLLFSPLPVFSPLCVFCCFPLVCLCLCPLSPLVVLVFTSLRLVLAVCSSACSERLGQ